MSPETYSLTVPLLASPQKTHVALQAISSSFTT